MTTPNQQEGCDRENHIHKGYFCEICEPERFPRPSPCHQEEKTTTEWGKEFDEKFGMPEFEKPTFVKHGTYTDHIKQFINSLLSSAKLQERQRMAEKVEGMWGVDAAWIENGLPKREIYLKKPEVLSLLHNDKNI